MASQATEVGNGGSKRVKQMGQEHRCSIMDRQQRMHIHRRPVVPVMSIVTLSSGGSTVHTI
jgi:hypothetical protein